MQNSLDNFAYQDVVSSDGKTYAELRKELAPSYSKVRLDLLKGYLSLFVILLIDFLLLRYTTIASVVFLPLSALALGYVLAYLHLFIHAGAHYDLHPVKSVNDKICDFLIGVIFGIRIKGYRKIHWQHHNLLGTKLDTEHSYFNELNSWFLLKSIAGIQTAGVILSRSKTAKSNGGRFPVSFFSVYVFALHASIVWLLFTIGGWALAVTWLTALIVVFPLLATIRQIMEHRDVAASGEVDYKETDHGKVNRLFGNGILDSSFGAAGFNKHLLHHWDPTISYTCLDKVEQFLSSCPETSAIISNNKTSYLKTFIALFKI